MAIKIPLLSGETLQQISVDIDDVPYVFVVQWNDYDKKFYMSILTTELIEVLSGICLVANTPLFKSFRNKLLPNGELALIRMSSKNEYPGFDELGIGFWLCYFPDNSVLTAPTIETLPSIPQITV